MRFIKNLFKSDPKEVVREQLLELDIPNNAINLSEEINEDNFRLVLEVADQLIDKGKLNGRLVGKKSWFLPDADTKLKDKWEKLQNGSLDLESISDEWGLNEKRVFIALKDYAKEQNQSEPIFYREEMTIYLYSYMKTLWMDELAGIDFEETPAIEFEKVINNISADKETRQIVGEQAKTWVQEESSNYALGEDEYLRRKDELPMTIKEEVEKEFEEGTDKITFFKISEKYGISEDEVDDILQNLVDENQLEEVTLYPLDKMIKPRI